ncbi:MAG: hypothetical protein IKU37_01600 [Candidatus Gastranaerophilales bacterium]|nr:hypothetical protein [Candidatus Gastranaerophilales bacterium]
MSTNSINNNSDFSTNTENSLLVKYGMNILNTPFVSDDNIQLGLGERYIIVEKLLEAHEFAKINVLAGNITGRGFATNVCTVDRAWSMGTNFNNTRNDISSICGERSAILTAYNEALIRYSRRPRGKFDFKVKYLCMASNIDLNEITEMIAPCEDCMSWLNTNRYFNFNTLVFSFERTQGELVVRASRLASFLPYKTYATSNEFDFNKEIRFSKNSQISFVKFKLEPKDALELLNEAYKKYQTNEYTNVSNQKVAASIISNNEVFSSSKIDWTKRWYVEPLESAASCAIEKHKKETNIKAIAYFGDEISSNSNEIHNDGVVSIKSLGRIRQKYASNDSLLVLNFKNYILITTIGEYLPKKFEQGYKIT